MIYSYNIHVDLFSLYLLWKKEKKSVSIIYLILDD